MTPYFDKLISLVSQERHQLSAVMIRLAVSVLPCLSLNAIGFAVVYVYPRFIETINGLYGLL